MIVADWIARIYGLPSFTVMLHHVAELMRRQVGMGEALLIASRLRFKGQLNTGEKRHCFGGVKRT